MIRFAAKKESKPTLRDRLRDGLVAGTTGAFLGSMVLDGKVKIPAAVRRTLRLKRKTMNVHGARVGGVLGAGLGVTAPEAVKDWRFEDGKKPLTPGQKTAIAAGGTLAAGGLVLGTARGRNALRSAMAGGNPLGGLLSKAPGGNPRRVRIMKAQQKRKDLSNQRAASRAVEDARAKFRAEALPKPPAEPSLGDAVKTVKKRIRRKVVKAVSNIGANPAETMMSAYIEDMTFSGLPKDVQKDVLRFVDAEKGTLVVHYGMTVKELLAKADPENLKAARKALGTLRASRAAEEVIGKIKDGSKYILLINDRIVDGHHFLAKAERGGVTSSLNVLDLTPARLTTRFSAAEMGRFLLTQFEEKKKSGWKRKAAIAAGATAGAVLGARTLPRLIRRGRPLKDGEELAGKVLYTNEGLTTPASVVNIGGKTLRRRLEKKALKGSKLAGAALKVDDFLGIPQRHYGIGAGGGRVIEKTKAHGHRMVDKGGFARGNRVHVDSDTLPKDSSKWGDWAKGMEKRNEAAQGKAKRGDLCLIGNNCEHHARDIAGQGRKSYQSRAIVGGAVGGAAAGGAAVGAVTKRKREERQMGVNAMLLHLFEEARERRNRVRDARDKIGLVKDVAGLGVIGGAGYGAHRLYKKGSDAIAQAGPKIDAAMQQVKGTAAAWKQTADSTNKNVQRVGRLATDVKRRLDAPKRKVMIEARMKLRNEKRKAAGRAPSNLSKAMQGKGVKAPKMAVGLIQRLMLNDPRPVHAFARRKQPQVVVQPPQRDGWQKARDGALIAGGAATVGAAGYTAHKAGKAIAGLAKRGRAALRQVPQVTDNIRNTTAIGADVGKVYRKARKVVTDSAEAFKGGMREASGKAAPSWAKRVVRVGKKLRLLEEGSRFPVRGSRLNEFQVPSSRARMNEFILGALGTIAGTLAGSAAGAKFRYPVQNALKKKLVPKLGRTWGRRVARAGAYAPENAGALLGGAAGSILTGGLRKKREEEDGSQFSVRGSRLNRLAWRALWEFGGREQLKDIDSSGFLDPLDVFVGRKKGYTAEQVKDYNRQKSYISDVKSGKRKGSPEAVKAAEDLMRNVRDNPTKAAHGQVVRSVLRKGDTVRKVAERGGGLIKDAAKELRGEGREKDRWGREKKREWEKPWFQRTKNQVIGAAALGGGALLLRKNPKIRAKVDRAIRVGKRKVNSVLPDLFPDAKPLRQPGQKTAATVHAKQQATAQAKAAKVTAQVTQAAQNIAKQAAAVKAGKPAGKSPPPPSVAPSSGGSVWGQSKIANEPPKPTAAEEAVKKAARKPRKPQGSKQGGAAPKKPTYNGLTGKWEMNRLLGQAFTQFADPLDVGWDIRDARGNSARVFAPQAGQRDRRPKRWHERVENERKLWAGAAAASTLAGGAAMRKLMGKRVTDAVKAERVKIREALQKVRKMRAERKLASSPNIVQGSFKEPPPSRRPAA